MARSMPYEDQDSDDGQRLCARAEWCKSYTLVTVDGHIERRPAETPRAFCDADRGDIARCLSEMPRQYLHLKHELARPGGSAQAVRMPFGPRVPLRVDVDALMRLFTECLYSWHERIAALDNLSFPDPEDSRRRRELLAVKRAADVLDGRLDALLALQPEPMVRAYDLRHVADLPDSTDGIVRAAFAEALLDLDGADAGNEILRLHYLARAMLGETRAAPQELEGVPCKADDCGLRALVRAEPPSDPDDPGKHSYCMACGATLDEDEYMEWVALCAAYERNTRRIPATLDELPSIDVLIATLSAPADAP